MKTLSIIGLGLMGGSLGLAAKKKGIAERVHAYARREETRNAALERGAADRAFDKPGEAVRDADIAVLCLPVLVIPQLGKEIKTDLPGSCVVTDVGSTKAELVAEMDELLSDVPARFVGSHPIAGSDETGLDAAREDLYEGAVVVVTPSEETRQDDALLRIADFWKDLGCRVIETTPAEHDRIIAGTSHLPHLVAALLVNSVYGSVGDSVEDFSGTGFRDTTRVAGGSEEIWHDIVKSNRHCVGRELDSFAELLEKVRAMVRDEDFEGLRAFLAQSRERRRNL